MRDQNRDADAGSNDLYPAAGFGRIGWSVTVNGAAAAFALTMAALRLRREWHAHVLSR